MGAVENLFQNFAGAKNFECDLRIPKLIPIAYQRAPIPILTAQNWPHKKPPSKNKTKIERILVWVFAAQVTLVYIWHARGGAATEGWGASGETLGGSTLGGPTLGRPTLGGPTLGGSRPRVGEDSFRIPLETL